MHWTASFGEFGIIRTQRRHCVGERVVFRVGVAREVVPARGGADRGAVAAVVQIDCGGRINRAGAVTEHIHAGFAIRHVLVGIGAEVDVGIETTVLQHFNQNGDDVRMDAFKTVDGAVDGLRRLFPTGRRRSS